MTGRRLLLVRHGLTDWNREGRFQGHLDPPLSDDGRLEARLLGERLRRDALLRPARIVSSTLARARETAETVAGVTNTTVEADARLIELGQGEWEGRTHGELERGDASRYAAWRRGGAQAPPGAEPAASAQARVDAVLADLSAAADGDWPVCVVSHGGTLRLAVRSLMRLDRARAWALDLDNAALSVCEAIGGGRWRLERWNDTAHLLGRLPTHVDETDGRPLAL